MERSGYRQQHRSFRAARFRELHCPLDRGLVAREDDLVTAVVVRCGTNFGTGCFRCDRFYRASLTESISSTRASVS